jgi:hypothetical protein
MGDLLRRAFVIARQRSDVGRRMPGMEVNALPYPAHVQYVSALGAQWLQRGQQVCMLAGCSVSCQKTIKRGHENQEARSFSYPGCSIRLHDGLTAHMCGAAQRAGVRTRTEVGTTEG